MAALVKLWKDKTIDFSESPAKKNVKTVYVPLRSILIVEISDQNHSKATAFGFRMHLLRIFFR